MADYCDLVLNVSLREDTPKDVIEFIQKCFDEDNGYVYATQSFDEEDEKHWCWILQSRGICFSGADVRIIKKDEYREDCFTIALRIRPLNYLSEVKKFLNFISPWIRDDLDTYSDNKYFMCGYVRGLEYKFPILIHYDMIDKQFIFFELNSVSKKNLQDNGLWSE